MLWNNESNPFCKKVREILCCLEIPYYCRNITSWSSIKRNDFRQRFGSIFVPFLEDPNTGIEMLDSEDIAQYLLKTYKIVEDKKCMKKLE